MNLTKLHIYEIKPRDGLAAGAAEVLMYLGIFRKAGITLSLGPPGAPGTHGTLPAPGGVFLFSSPAPGVITYKYRRGTLVPVPTRAPVAQGVAEPARARPSSTKSERWHIRWELEPLSPPMQRAIATAAVGGTLLILAIILLAPVGV